MAGAATRGFNPGDYRVVLLMKAVEAKDWGVMQRWPKVQKENQVA